MIDNVLDFKILINLNVNMLFFTYVGIHIIIDTAVPTFCFKRYVTN